MKIHINGPKDTAPETEEEIIKLADNFWLLKCAREIDDAILNLRFNELDIGVIIFTSHGSLNQVIKYDKLLLKFKDNWFINEIKNLWYRTLKRIDVTSRSLITMIEPGSCFGGILAELIFCSDRSFMAEGFFEDRNYPEASIILTDTNFNYLTMSNGLCRIETRFLNDESSIKNLKKLIGIEIKSNEAKKNGLITFDYDEIDWDDEIRIFLEERSSFSPDSMSGLEANLRFAGPETMETKIFGRLTAWQNWIFQRPNAVGEEGALKNYGTGNRSKFNKERI